MPTDSLLVKILLIRSEAQPLFNVQPSAKLRSKLDACDAVFRYLLGACDEFVRRDSLHGNLRTEGDDRHVPRQDSI